MSEPPNAGSSGDVWPLRVPEIWLTVPKRSGSSCRWPPGDVEGLDSESVQDQNKMLTLTFQPAATKYIVCELPTEQMS